MKVWKLISFSLLLGFASSAVSACDGMMVEEPATVSSALAAADDVIVDGKIITGPSFTGSASRRTGKVVAPADHEPADGYITSSGGGRTTVFNDYATEDNGPGVVKDCSAKATDCNVQCTVVGQGTCSSGSTSVECSLIYPCGENMCERSRCV